MNIPPIFTINSNFEKWRIDFAEFIAKRENGADLIKSFTEGPFIKPLKYVPATAISPGSYILKPIEEYTIEESLRYQADRDSKYYLMRALPNPIYKNIQSFSNNPLLMWNALTKHILGSEVPFIQREEEEKTEKKEENMSEAKSESLKDQVTELTKKLVDMKRLLKVEREDLRKEKTERSNEKKTYEKQILSLSQKVSRLENELKNKKDKEDKKVLEQKYVQVLQQNSDFEKVLFLEKEKLEKERTEFELQRQSLEANNEKLSKKISELQDDLTTQRKEQEKQKDENSIHNESKDNFSEER